jgi:hypothetical protein
MATDLGKGGRNKPNARARAAALREQQRKKEARRKWLLTGGVVVIVRAVIGAMIGIYATRGGKKNADAGRPPAAASVVKDVTTVPDSAFATVGAGATTGAPKKITGDPLVFDGKPGLFYYGAEFCPYCATERWPVVVALSRFGTWSNLHTTTSASQDVYPNTATFSFYGAKYSSPYLGFQAVETTTNQMKNGNWEPLQKPTDAQAALVSKYDGPNGSIPFIDFGNKFMVSGATYNPQVLQGKSIDEIASALGDTSTDVSKSVLGAANQVTAAVCEMTGGKPGSVCDAPAIKSLRATLNAGK